MSAKVTPSVTSYVSPLLTPLFYSLGRYVVLPCYFGRIKVFGWQNLPKTAPLLLAPTHRSRWDAFMIPYVAGRDVTGRDLRFMVTHDEMQGIQGWFVRRFGGFPVDTRRPTIGSLRHGVELLQARENLVIFPEGNIFRDRQIRPLKPGLARLAIQSEADKPGLGLKIVPITIYYSQPIPRWGCDVSIQIGAPLKVAPYCVGPAKPAAQQLTTDLEVALKTLLSCGVTANTPANP